MRKAPAIMKIVIHTEPVSLTGKYHPVSLDMPPREVYLQDERCAPGLERIILAGIDSMTCEYLDAIEFEMHHTVKR